MDSIINMKILARVQSDFSAKFGIPRQSGLAEELKAMVILEPEFRNPDVFRGLEQYSHIWLLWQFSETAKEGWSPTVRPPRLGGNKRVGVFATRSPFRPNPIGLSSVRLDGIRNHPRFGPVLLISGADLMDGTPVLDIKPYIPYADSHPDAKGGFAQAHKDDKLLVEFPEQLLCRVPPEKREALIKVLALDPRPSYQRDAGRIYGFEFAGMEIRFRVEEKTVMVCEVD